MANIGYARVSTDKQELALQLDALKAAGCTKIFKDTASGAKRERKGLADALDYMRPGDALVAYKLDRLARSMLHLAELAAQLEKMGCGLKLTSQPIDTTTPGGKFAFGIFASLAEFERALIRERTNEGLKAARARGNVGGRPPKLDDETWATVQTLIKGGMSVAAAARKVGVARSAIYQKVRRAGGQGVTLP